MKVRTDKWNSIGFSGSRLPDAMTGTLKIIALLTCFNRREKTICCLERFLGQELPPGVALGAVVVDDGSTDETGEAVARKFPGVELIKGTGNLYWCGGMRLAWQKAAQTDPDYYVLLNDDTHLEPFAVDRLLALAGSPDSRRIAVGAIRDPETGEATYGGWQGRDGLIHPNGGDVACDTFNGNCVLIPRGVYEEMGILSGIYTHGMADFDYGFQAGKRGISIIQSGCFVGTCSRNKLDGSWRDKNLTRIQRLRHLQSPKGLPWKEWVAYNRRNSGWKWPLLSVSPFIRILMGR